jgi:hypothetical protein
MSKLKTPQDKKRLSLDRDGRNAYGENAKSSRKNIPLSKQLSHQATRKAANQATLEVLKLSGEEQTADAEVDLRATVLEMERKAFRKWPDAPLGAKLIRQRTGKYPPAFSGKS